MTQEHSDDRIQALGALSAGIAHHFNNLLSVILGYSSHLLNRMELPEEAHDALLRISEAAQRGRRMTEEILGFTGSETEEETLCSLHQMLDGLCPLLENQAAGRFRFIRHYDAEHAEVRTQRSALQQSLYNLLTNFIDEHSDAGGDIHIFTGNLQRREADQRVNYLQIRVASCEDPNCEDQVELMLTQDDHSSAKEIATATPKKLASHSIWVVDDDPIFCEMCERVLGDDGHRVTSIPSGPALQDEYMATDSQPDLLIIDFSMPDSNGLELRTWLRSEGCRAPVILVSGFTHTHPDIRKALKMRKTYFLQKPFPVPELADIVSVALGETLLGQ